MKTALIGSAVLLGALCNACGGGGGRGGNAMQLGVSPQDLESAPAPSVPFNIPAATLTASSAGNSYTAIYSETPDKGVTLFNGQEASSSTISLAITENGSSIVSETETDYYLVSPYQPLGLTLSSAGGQFDLLYNSISPLPSMLEVGASGPLASGTYYIAGTNDGAGSLTETYSVTSTDSNTVLLTTSATGTLNGQPVSQTINYAVNASGGFELQSIELAVNGTTLTFTNTCTGCWDY